MGLWYWLALGIAGVALCVGLFLKLSNWRSGPGRPEFTGRTLLVPDDFPTIGGALEAAAEGDTIKVLPGVYREQLELGEKGIRLMSSDPGEEEIVRSTVIEGAGSDSVVVFEAEESTAVALEGFTIRGGGGRIIYSRNVLGNAARVGGGIYVGSEASPYIRHNIICGNRADLGGGLYVSSNSLGTIEKNRIVGNTAVLGGGMRVAWDFRQDDEGPTSSRESFFGQHELIIRSCEIAENEAHIGGGISVARSAAPLISSNSIHHNTVCWDGGGIAIWDSSTPSIEENHLHHNSAGSDYGFGGGISAVNNCRPVVVNNTIEKNSASGRIDAGGGGVAVNRSQVELRGNTVVENSASVGQKPLRGANLFIWGNSSVELEDNKLAEETIAKLESEDEHPLAAPEL